MSTVTEKLEAIKKLLFNAEQAPAATVVAAPAAFELKDQMLQDGTVIQVDNLAVGGQVVIAGVPAPDGEYSLQDGSAITVIGGLITEVEAVEPVDGTGAAAAPAGPEMMSKEDGAKLSAAIAYLSGRFLAQDKANKAIVELIGDMQKFEVQAPAKAPIDLDKMTPLQKFRATK